MRVLAVGFALFALASGAFAQIDPNRPILLTGPDARGSSLVQAREVVQLAAAHGYNGVSVGVGMSRISNPTTIDYSGVKAITKDAMAAGLKYVCFRLDIDIPNNQAWADEFNGGDVWPIATRPPEATWPKIAQIWQGVRDTAAAEVTAVGKDPSTALIFVLGNEPGIGGVGAPSLGPWSYSGFFYSLYQQTGDPTWFLVAFPQELLGQPEGYIDPGYWTMLRGVRSRVNFGAKNYCVSFEGFEGSLPGQINSVTGPDAQWLYVNTSGFGINIFGTNARPTNDSITGVFTRASLTPVQEATAFLARLDKLVAIIRANPILANSPMILTEFNISVGRIPILADPFQYRESLLKATMAYPGAEGAAMFSAYADDPTSASFQLFNRTIVNGSVVTQPVGSGPVGPAYIGSVP